MKILIYGTDSEKMKAAAIQLRAEDPKHVVNLRSSKSFNVVDIEPSFNTVILLEESDAVQGAYEAWNKNQEDESQRVEIECRFDFEPKDVKELSKLEGHPYWSDMTVKELIEYARDELDTKILGRTKKEIVAKVEILWKEQNAVKQPEDAEADITIS